MYVIGDASSGAVFLQRMEFRHFHPSNAQDTTKLQVYYATSGVDSIVVVEMPALYRNKVATVVAETKLRLRTGVRTHLLDKQPEVWLISSRIQ